LCGCKKTTSDTYSLNEEQVRRQDSLFNNVNQKWIFEQPETPKIVQDKINEWKDWHNLLEEFSSKPLSSISAVREEAENLAKLGDKMHMTHSEYRKIGDVLSINSWLNM